VPVGRLDRFRHAGDAAAAWPNHIVRDATYLNWRFRQSPRRYDVLAAGGEYVVLAHKEHRGTRLAYIADLVGNPRALVPACLVAAERGVRAVVAVPAPGQRAAYAALGFVPTRTTLDLMGKPLAGELQTDAGAWRFTLGDTDFF
jgi:hypothetical protein